MGKSKFTVRGLFNNNKFVLFFSLIIAIVFWVVISVVETPNAEKTISGLSITVPIENTAAESLNLQVMDDIEDYRVEVTVRGPSYVVSTLSRDDITITASPTDSDRNFDGAGTYNIKLRATKQSSISQGEYEILSVSPSTVSLTFDRYVEEPLEIDSVVECANISATQGLIRGEAVVDGENTLYFKGAKTKVDQIAKVVAKVSETQTISATTTYDASLVIYDENNDILPLEDYEIVNSQNAAVESVKVRVPINKSVSVSVKATYQNAPAYINGSAVNFALDHSKVQIEGPVEEIDKITVLELEPIDFCEVTENGQTFSRKFANLPLGVEVTDNIEEITVTVKGMQGYTNKTFTVSKISLSGASTYNVTLSRNIKNVKICGSKDFLKNLDAENLYAVIDPQNISGFRAGEYTVPVVIKCQTSNEVWQIDKYNAVINIAEDIPTDD